MMLHWAGVARPGWGMTVTHSEGHRALCAKLPSFHTPITAHGAPQHAHVQQAGRSHAHAHGRMTLHAEHLGTCMRSALDVWMHMHECVMWLQSHAEAVLHHGASSEPRRAFLSARPNAGPADEDVVLAANCSAADLEACGKQADVSH